MNKVFTADEQMVMDVTFKASMLRAADIIDKVTEDEVTEAQAYLLSTGSTLTQVARIDRGMIASAHLRICASMGHKSNGTVGRKACGDELRKGVR